ncbi:TetR/AcrR family transcriptional regulator [Actinoplanes philippinensis]|uniref:TetR/AcrR family transcriptional regulator n=1 Tax=Actinoplanes philippinensis TaxID=35752 RepID=UPI0019437239|nr:TetR/AcrR family transcriptional regulator [Actinoplanes philippinensis]
MTTGEPETPATLGRPRDPDLEQAILDATVEVILQRGYSATKLDEIARRAGTGKAAIYRRWASKTDLVIAAAQSLQAEVTLPDEGSLRDDLLVCVRHYVTPTARAALVLANVLNEMPHDDDVREAAIASIARPAAQALRTVIDRWIAGGAVDPAVPAGLVASIVPSMAFHRVALLRQGLDEETAVALVDSVLLPALGVATPRPACDA